MKNFIYRRGYVQRQRNGYYTQENTIS